MESECIIPLYHKPVLYHVPCLKIKIIMLAGKNQEQDQHSQNHVTPPPPSAAAQERPHVSDQTCAECG